MAYSERSFPSADGHLTLFARDYPASPGADRKMPLLMMHGLTRNSADFEPLAALLSERRRLIVPDQRGRGRSQYDPDPSRYAPDIYVEDMWALLEVLEIERVICVGTSMGGLMSMVMGAQQPNRIGAIVLNDIGPEVSAAGLDRIRSYVGGGAPMASWDAAAARCQEINGDALIGLDHDGWLAFAKRTCVEHSDGSIAFNYDPAIAQSVGEQDPATIPADLWGLWSGLTNIPVLSIRGSHSDILTASTVEQMEQLHPAAFWRVEVPQRGHAPLLDEAPAVEAINAFLARHA